MCVCACVYVCVRACVRACVCACVHALMFSSWILGANIQGLMYDSSEKQYRHLIKLFSITVKGLMMVLGCCIKYFTDVTHSFILYVNYL